MNNEPGYTLEELANHFGLTLRTARHYIGNVLPPHHKKGRGKLARYGQDTWNCFTFVQKAREERLTAAQISRVLGELSQEQIDRVAQGQEQLAIVPASTVMDSPRVERLYSPRTASASRRLSKTAASEPGSAPRWQVLYSDDELQIAHQGDADREQREQVRMAAKLIKLILNKRA
jgi:DNA-binding transcriptional MerR regulator